MKLLAKTAVTVGASVAMLGGFASAASAAPAAEAPVTIAVTCSGTGCDGKDPYATDCDASKVEVGRKASSKGTFILYYSRTCKTNWIETPNFAGGTSRLELAVWDRGRDKFVTFPARPTPGRHWGDMVYSPGSSCAMGLADWNLGDWDVIIPSSGC
jgi:uncharacterized protein DUF2690